MFKKLGYEKQVYDDFIVYVKGNYIMFHIIEFHLKNKIVQSHREDCEIGIVIKSLTVDELKAIIQQAKELGWLEEKDENFEEKQETNYEHFKDEIIENSGYCFALVDGKPCQCSSVSCCDCGFSTGHGCSETIKEWLKSPCKKPTYKLSKFEYDLLNVHKDYKTYNNIANQIHLFKMREKGYFKGIDTNIPIREILDNCEVI